jgi:hypothetical protein
MQYLLNIGVAREGNSNIGVGTVLRELGAIGAIIGHTVQHSETEVTVVALVQIPGTTQHAGNEIFHLANLLGQECIAVYNMATETGALIGPRADKWGAFNPDFFLLCDGSKLSDPEDFEVAA